MTRVNIGPVVACLAEINRVYIQNQSGSPGLRRSAPFPGCQVNGAFQARAGVWIFYAVGLFVRAQSRQGGGLDRSERRNGAVTARHRILLSSELNAGTSCPRPARGCRFAMFQAFQTQRGFPTPRFDLDRSVPNLLLIKAAALAATSCTLDSASIKITPGACPLSHR